MQEQARQEQQSEDSQAQPGSSEHNQPRGDQRASSPDARCPVGTNNQSEEDTPVKKEFVVTLLGEKIPQGGVVGAAAAQL
jgi:hypothetical protein